MFGGCGEKLHSFSLAKRIGVACNSYAVSGLPTDRKHSPLARGASPTSDTPCLTRALPQKQLSTVFDSFTCRPHQKALPIFSVGRGFFLFGAICYYFCFFSGIFRGRLKKRLQYRYCLYPLKCLLPPLRSYHQRMSVRTKARVF